jgi:xanthine dehydrogenase small subunit
VGEARLAFGGMAAVVARAPLAEAALAGAPWDDSAQAEAAVARAGAALAQDFRPIDDLRASAGHRLQASANLLRRLWLETRLAAPLPPQATSVFARGDATAP